MSFTGLTLPVASDTAERFVDFYNAFLVLSFILFFSTVLCGLYCIVKYRRRGPDDKTAYIKENHWLEWGSMFVIGVVATVIFIWGFRDYMWNISPKMDEYEVNVLGQQWSWQISYTNGIKLSNMMVLPKGRPIKLIMSSKDVIHSFFVPAFRIKQDVVPGLFTSLRFTPTKVGIYDVLCAEYCGTSHSLMLAKVHVLEEEDFKKWEEGLYTIGSHSSKLAKKEVKKISSLEQGTLLYKSKTCNVCHSVDDSPLIGPSFQGLWGKKIQLKDGKEVLVDENYIRESLMDPGKKIRKGYSPSMPTYRGQLSEEEINHLIAYIKSLKGYFKQ